MTVPTLRELEDQARRIWRFQRFMARQRDVLPAEERLLWEVGDAPQGVGHGQLCARLGIDTTNLGRLARLLVAKGLVRSSRAHHDLRMTVYESTAEGRRAHALIEQSGIEALKAQLSHTNALHCRGPRSSFDPCVPATSAGQSDAWASYSRTARGSSHERSAGRMAG